MRIALLGGSLSGKSTLADYLVSEYGWTKLNYTDLLKEAAVEALDAAHKVLGYAAGPTIEHVLRNKKVYRPFINELGTCLGFDQGEGVDLMLSRWSAKGCPEPVVWDCVRFEAQADQLRKAGFVMVKVDTDHITRWERAQAKGLTRPEFDQQEAWEPEVDGELFLDGTQPTEHNAEILNRLAGLRLEQIVTVSTKGTKVKGHAA